MPDGGHMPVTVQQIQAFVKANAMSHDEATLLAGRAMEPGYWLSVCPWLSISKSRRPPASVEPSMTDIAETLDEYWRSGYGACEDAFDLSDITRLEKAVFAVNSAGW